MKLNTHRKMIKGEKIIIGIIANITKKNVYDVVSLLIEKLKAHEMDFLLSESIGHQKELLNIKVSKTKFLPEDKLCKKSDVIISIGGDGTMLNTAFKAQYYEKPVLGVNFGKLGFLAEVKVSQLDGIIKEIKAGRYQIEERMIIEGKCNGHSIEKLYAINDIVIDKAGWPKMIELTIYVDGQYVTSFDADGLIISTPTGSTGYAISTGGPIVSPQTNVITICPISPHSLTMRPLVLPGTSTILIKAESMHKEVLANCDGQRVYSFHPPLEIEIRKSERPFKLVHTSFTNYFETLRNKLLWGIDVRKKLFNSENENETD